MWFLKRESRIDLEKKMKNSYLFFDDGGRKKRKRSTGTVGSSELAAVLRDDVRSGWIRSSSI